MYSVCARPWSYDHRPLHPYYAGTEHVAFSPTRQGGGCTRFVHGGGGRTHLLLDLVTSTIDHVFLSKRSDIPTPVKDTSNSLRAHYVFFLYQCPLINISSM